jgi:Spy/CpxP family protein refolding chaperone
MIGSKIRTLAVPVVAGLLVPTALAGSTAAATASVHRATSHRRLRAQQAHGHHGGIPQHNGGDRDSDNNGASSDDDGNQ